MTSDAVAPRPNWLQDPTLAWRPAARGVVLCAQPHDLAACLGPNAAEAAVDIGPPGVGYDHLCGLQELLAVLLPAVRGALPEVLERHAEVVGLLTRQEGPDGEGAGRRGRFVPVSETASLGTTRRISRESHITAGWIDRAARFLVDALPALGGRPVLVVRAFDHWDRISVRILYRTVLIADQQGRSITVRGLLRDGGTLFLERLSRLRAVRVCAALPPVPDTPRGAPGLAVEAWRSGGPANPLRAIGDAIALQNFERADLLIAAHLEAVGAEGGRADDLADLIRLQAISEAQTGRIDTAVAKLERSLDLAEKPELRAHLNYLIALLVTKRKDDTQTARAFYLRGLECIDALDTPGVDAQVEKAWILNGLALAAAIDARATEDTERRDVLFKEAFELEFDAFRMVREMPGDSAFYLRYNLSHNLAFLLQITGRHRQAEDFLRSVSATMLGTGRPEFFVPHHYAIAVLQLRRGSHEEAAASFGAAVRVAGELRDPFHLEKLFAAAGYTDLRRGDHAAAARHYRDAARTARRLCDEPAFAQDLAGLLWALTLGGSRWDRHTLTAARIWYPEAAGAYDRGVGGEELAEALTQAGAEIAPPSSKLPSYLAAVDLEGLPDRDLNRFLAGITARENPGRLLGEGAGGSSGEVTSAERDGESGAVTSAVAADTSGVVRSADAEGASDVVRSADTEGAFGAVNSVAAKGASGAAAAVAAPGAPVTADAAVQGDAAGAASAAPRAVPDPAEAVAGRGRR
ncbi:tetratricopeptide repeat protein [Streptomyces sp. NPDC006465]|uniref:tetratricopeptide repeat protein n=1 Tax=Streptomyces sp. NPDC006465 TaxID=3157174 RepID=UPI0033B58832